MFRWPTASHAWFFCFTFLALVVDAPRIAAADPGNSGPVRVSSVAAGACHSLFLEKTELYGLRVATIGVS